MKEFSQHLPAKELFSLFDKTSNSLIKLMDCTRGDYS